MCRAVGVETPADLFADVPAAARLALAALAALPARGEPAILAEAAALARDADRPCDFKGAGAYRHHVPPAVDAIASRGEFLTAYTPYQPEVSQGTLAAIFEFQSMVCALTGMDVANASLYDGASALAEACLMAIRETGRRRVLAPRALNPRWRAVLRTYLSGIGAAVDEVPIDGGATPAAEVRRRLGDDVAAVVVANPNFFGVLEPEIDGAVEAARAAGALVVFAFDPVSLGLLRTPGEWGADIAVGEGQPLGIPLSAGGPYLGLIAARGRLVRRLPGRIAGKTVDRRGKTCYVLTLQAREQHIRRERATSNVCTNQANMALRAAIHLALLGPAGLRDVAERSHAAALAAAGRLRAAGARLPFDLPFFREFAVEGLDPAADLGVPLDRDYPEHAGARLVAFTETTTPADVERLVAAVRA